MVRYTTATMRRGESRSKQYQYWRSRENNHNNTAVVCPNAEPCKPHPRTINALRTLQKTITPHSTLLVWPLPLFQTESKQIPTPNLTRNESRLGTRIHTNIHTDTRNALLNRALAQTAPICRCRLTGRSSGRGATACGRIARADDWVFL